jgi:hypothetical protein
MSWCLEPQGSQAPLVLCRLTQDMVVAVYSQECQYRVMKSHHLHKQRIHEYCSRYCGCGCCCSCLLCPPTPAPTPTCATPPFPGRYLSGTDLLELCADVEFPPCLMMRRFLEHLLQLPNKVKPGAHTSWRRAESRQWRMFVLCWQQWQPAVVCLAAPPVPSRQQLQHAVGRR